MTTATVVDTSTASEAPWYRVYSSSRLQIWYDASTLYEVFNGSSGISPNGWVYRKSSDAGATWGSRVALVVGQIAFDLYYERWNDLAAAPYLHVVSHNDDFLHPRGVYYNRLDLSSETLLYGSLGTSLLDAFPQPDGSPDTIAVTRSGAVHVTAFETAVGGRLHVVSADHGATWTAAPALPDQDIRDLALALPDGVSADPADYCVIWIDFTAQTLYLSNWDASAGSWSRQTIATGIQAGAEESIYRNLAAAYDRASGHSALVAYPDDASPNTLYAWEIAGTTVTPRQAVLTAVANANVCAVSITAAGHVRVSYTRGATTATAVYYKESTDFMQTWGAEQAYSTLAAMALVRIDADPSPAVALYEPAYWTDIVGFVPDGFGSHLYVEVPAAGTTPPPPPPVREAVPGVILRALYLEGVAVNSRELTLEQAPPV